MRVGLLSAASAGGLLLATGLAIGLAMPAYADVITMDPGSTYIDPTVLHVGADSSGGPGNDPNLISSNGEFFVANVSGQDINSPIDLFFIEAFGSSAPSVTGVKLGASAVTFSPVGPATDTGDTVSSGQDAYTQLGCTKCDNSVSYVNMTGTLTTLGLTVPSKFEIFETVVNSGLPGGGFLDVTGSFAQGTFIIPFAENVAGDKVTLFDTSYTNTGFIDATPGGPRTGGVPEPRTWVMMLAGFGLLGFAAMRKGKREARLAT
jgi:hypothetical protein